MKRYEISQLWGEILFNNLLTLVITVAALGFLSIHILNGRAWAVIVGIAVIGIFLTAQRKEPNRQGGKIPGVLLAKLNKMIALAKKRR